jgi:putative transposase
MAEYRKTSHCVYDIKYHIVWITKYRKPVLAEDIGKRLRDLVRVLCTSLDVQIVKGHVSRDHVHLLVSVPPYVAVSKLVQRIKGVTSRKLLMENKRLNKAFWGRHLWARGYFAASTGNVTEEVIKKYIEEQEQIERDHDADFKVDP